MNNIENCMNASSQISFYKNDSRANDIFVKRDDKIGPDFGGNKARKLEYFFEDINNKKVNYIVTYGSTHSNHCRLTASYAAQFDLSCLLILAEPEQEPEYNGNFFLYDLLDAEITYTSVDSVEETISNELERLKSEGYNPYFIPGGGHGNLGTEAYVEASREIKYQEEDMNIYFDYIFFASGTGTTQAGLVIGNEIYDIAEEIIGISIAREEERGRKIIGESIKEYCDENEISMGDINKKINFVTDFIGDGYGDTKLEVKRVIKKVAKKEGIMLDPIYTGKAFYGMQEYIRKNDIKDQNILFIHTGGIPIIFNHTEEFKNFQE